MQIQRYRKLVGLLATGGISFSLMGTLELVDFGSVFTSFLSRFFLWFFSAVFGTNIFNLVG
jgi:hypothetical protein